MTINGPAPSVLAFYMNAAIDAAIERKLKADGKWPETEKKIIAYFAERGARACPARRASGPRRPRCLQFDPRTTPCGALAAPRLPCPP